MRINHLRVFHTDWQEAVCYDMTEDLTIIHTHHADLVSYLLERVLNHKPYSPLPCVAGGNTEITAGVTLYQKQYQVRLAYETEKDEFRLLAYDDAGKDVTAEYCYFSSHCQEQDVAEVFDGKETGQELRFLRYVGADDFSCQELSKRTDGMSETSTFRAYCYRFIKNVSPELIRKGKRYQIALGGCGVYEVRFSGEGDAPVCLSESEQKIFGYLCFLQAAEFWHGFEEIRNIHGIKKPLLIKNFLEYLDESIETDAWMQRTMQLGRQVILLTK